MIEKLSDDLLSQVLWAATLVIVVATICISAYSCESTAKCTPTAEEKAR